MYVKSWTVCLLVVVLIQAVRDVPCVSARNLLQFPFRGIPDLTKGIPNLAGSPSLLPGVIPGVSIPGINGPPASIPGLPVSIPGINGPSASISGLPGLPFSIPGINGPPASIPGLPGLPFSIPGINGPPASIPGFSFPGMGSSTPSESRPSQPKVEDESGTTITETFYISTKGLGSTTVSASTHIPPLEEIQVPDVRTFVTNLLSNTFLPKSPPASTPSNPTPDSSNSESQPIGFPFGFPKFPGLP